MLFLHWFLLTWHLAKFPHYVYIALGTVQVQSEQSTVLDREPNSNLYQLLWLLARKGPAFDSWLREKITYTSPECQNEMIEIISCMVLRKLVKDIRANMYYTIMVDESPDCSNKKQAVFCIR